jgi:hypothetical protein
MDNSSFWFALGCVAGSLARNDLQEYLANEGFTKEDQEEFKKHLHKIISIAYKKDK